MIDGQRHLQVESPVVGVADRNAVGIRLGECERSTLVELLISWNVVHRRFVDVACGDLVAEVDILDDLTSFNDDGPGIGGTRQNEVVDPNDFLSVGL